MGAKDCSLGCGMSDPRVGSGCPRHSPSLLNPISGLELPCLCAQHACYPVNPRCAGQSVSVPKVPSFAEMRCEAVVTRKRCCKTRKAFRGEIIN
eukprot:498053-Rhodomonas_salina.1